jgi:hypothetical protein
VWPNSAFQPSSTRRHDIWFLILLNTPLKYLTGEHGRVKDSRDTQLKRHPGRHPTFPELTGLARNSLFNEELQSQLIIIGDEIT